MDELVLFPQGEHDDLFDGLQTMVEGAERCAAETSKNQIDSSEGKEEDTSWRKSDPSSYGVGCYGYS